MNNKSIKLTEKKMEKTISSIGAKIADANDIAGEIEELSELEQKKLDAAQEELSDLYVSLDDLKPQKEKPHQKELH